MLSRSFIAIRQDRSYIALVHADLDEVIFPFIDEKEFLFTLKEALTEWRDSTDSGKEAWEDSDEDFNIGDLSSWVPTSFKEDLFKIPEELSHILHSHGILNLTVDIYHIDAPGSWTYDTVLMY